MSTADYRYKLMEQELEAANQKIDKKDGQIKLLREALTRISGNNLQSNPCIVATAALEATKG